jgi:hypothetical protein
MTVTPKSDEVGLWHFSEVLRRSSDVRCWGRTDLNLGRFQAKFHLTSTKRPCHLDGAACRCTVPADQPDGIDIRNALPVRFEVCAERRYLLGFEINFGQIKLQICFYN